MSNEESKNDLVKEARELLASGSLLLPLRVEGWHMSLHSGGWHIKNASDRIVMTVAFVPVEIETGKPAIDGNAPARHTAALLNAIPALCDEVERLRQEVAQYEQTDLVPRSRYDAANADWLEAREQVKTIAQKAASEIDRLGALNQTQAESIETFQSQLRVMKEAIEAGIDFIDAIGRDIHYVYSPEAAASVQQSADDALTQLRSAITPKEAN